jgi:nicotinamide-nucleotide amidase
MGAADAFGEHRLKKRLAHRSLFALLIGTPAPREFSLSYPTDRRPTTGLSDQPIDQDAVMISAEAEQLAQRLTALGWRIVFAESCTAGWVPALMAAIPGISERMCGSWVVYREECKQAWLGVPDALLRQKSAVSPEVTAVMAVEALRRTASANVSAAITGHLGPAAPAPLDGVCFMAVAVRRVDQIVLLGEQRVTLRKTKRGDRQNEAARGLLRFCSSLLGNLTP